MKNADCLLQVCLFLKDWGKKWREGNRALRFYMSTGDTITWQLIRCSSPRNNYVFRPPPLNWHMKISDLVS